MRTPTPTHRPRVARTPVLAPAALAPAALASAALLLAVAASPSDAAADVLRVAATEAAVYEGVSVPPGTLMTFTSFRGSGDQSLSIRNFSTQPAGSPVSVSLAGFDVGSALPDGATINAVTLEYRVIGTTAATTGVDVTGEPYTTAVDFAGTSAFPPVYATFDPPTTGPGEVELASSIHAELEAAELFALRFTGQETANVRLAGIASPFNAPPTLRIDFTPVPEPAAAGVLALVGLAGLRRRR